MRNWQGKIWIDIREFFVKDGKKLPGKKGFFLVFLLEFRVSLLSVGVELDLINFTFFF